MPKSVGPDDGFLNRIAAAALNEPGDARRAWKVVAHCTAHALEYPMWVRRYLAETAERLEDFLYTENPHPIGLRHALSFNRRDEVPETIHDRKRDPETVYWTIKEWMDADGATRGATSYYERYWCEILDAKLPNGDVKPGPVSPETVRGWYNAGRKIAKRAFVRGRRGPKPADE